MLIRGHPPFSKEGAVNIEQNPVLVCTVGPVDVARAVDRAWWARQDSIRSREAAEDSKRPKAFDTPIGSFIYRQAPHGYFHLGMDRAEEGDVAFLIAVPERALADKVRDDRRHRIRSQTDAARYLFDDLRIEREEFAQLSPSTLELLAKAARSRRIAICAKLLRKLKDGP